MVHKMAMVTQADEASVFLSWVNIERASVIGILLLMLSLFALGKILTRRSADVEKAALVSGYQAKDEAHEEIIQFKNEQISALTEANSKLAEVNERQSDQLSRILDEVVPTLRAWEQATRRASEMVKGGEDDGHGTT